MPTIVTLTLNPCLDKSTAVQRVVSEDKLRCEDPTYDPGGGGINVSRAIKKLGGESLAVFTSGGGQGQMLQDLLASEGLAMHPINTQSATRENLIVYERSSTHQYRFGMPGGYIREEELQDCLDVVFAQNADIIVGSGSLPPGVANDFYAEFAKRAHATSAKVIVDTSGAALEAMVGTGVYLLKPNINELEILSGETFEGEEQMIRVARRMIAENMAQVLVISLGAQGAALVTADEFVQMQPPVVKVVSKVGAGDSMVGGIVFSLAKNDSLRDALRYGIASGTAAVMNPGADLCRKEDVEILYPRVKVVSEE
jgi:6-phosphofructokinase 2